MTDRPGCFRFFAGLLLVCCLFSGCDSELLAPSTEPVSGTIIFEGQPLADAEIILVPLGTNNGYGRFDSVSRGKTGPDGCYSLKTVDGRTGAMRGVHLVLISKQKTESPRIASGPGEDEGNPLLRRPVSRSGQGPDLFRQLIDPWMVAGGNDDQEIVPAHYNRDSILTVEIGKGGNPQLDFRLNLLDPWVQQSQTGRGIPAD